MPKKKESLRIAANNNYSELWIPEELKPYLNDTPEIRALLEGFTSFTPHKWDPDALVEWVSTTFSTSLAENLLTADGYERARNLYTQRRIKVEDWALSRPGWWATFEGWRTRHLADSFIYEPPMITPEELPLACESWWRMYIKEPVESDPRRRCAYLVAAGLLPKDFTADDLIQFAANRRREPSPDTTYAEWELTQEGNAELTAGVRKKTEARTRRTRKIKNFDIPARLKVNCWEGLAVEVHESLIRVSSKDTPKNAIDIGFNELGIDKGQAGKANNSFRLILFLAKTPGEYNPDKDKNYYGGPDGPNRFKQDLFRLNRCLREAIGLTGTPIWRSRKKEDMGIVKTRFEIYLSGREQTRTDSKGNVTHIVSDQTVKNMKRVTASPEVIQKSQ